MQTVVGLAELEVDVGTLDRGAETDAVDFEVLRVTLADSNDHVGDQALRGAVEGADATVFGFAGDVDMLGIGVNDDALRDGPGELALGSFDLHGAVSAELDADLVRDGDGLFAYA
jgi:hypothetical protein